MPEKPEHFNLLTEDEMKVWVPKGMTFQNNLVKVIALPYKGKKVLKVSTAQTMEGEGCD